MFSEDTFGQVLYFNKTDILALCKYNILISRDFKNASITVKPAVKKKKTSTGTSTSMDTRTKIQVQF